MLSIFRTNQAAASILLIFYLVVLRLGGFLVPVEWTPGPHGVAAVWLYDLIGYQGLWPNILAIILLLGHALFINVLGIEHRLANEVNLFPGLFYALVASALPAFQFLSPQLLANTFFLIALWELMNTYRRPECAGEIFNAGFWVSVAALFYPAYLWFVLLGFTGLNLLRAFRIRERLMLLAGAFVPLFLSGVYFFWFDRLDEFFRRQFLDSFAFWDFRFPADTWLYVQLVLFGLALLTVLFSANLYFSKKIMQVQKKISLLFWALLIGGLTVIFQADVPLDHLLVLAIPLGILLSFNFTDAGRGTAEVLHLLLVAAVLFLQYRVFFLGG